MSLPDPARPMRAKYIGIDPGRTKCGFAVVYDDGGRECIDVVPTVEIEQHIDRQLRTGPVAAICIGDATSSAAIIALCSRRWPAVPQEIIDETNTTFEARKLYFADHPPRGIWRFVPRGLLVPTEPIDGYAAVLIVERYLRWVDECLGLDNRSGFTDPLLRDAGRESSWQAVADGGNLRRKSNPWL